MNFKTVFSALVTPFKNQEVDFDSLKKLVRDQIQRGVGGFVINGTTAESPTLEWHEVEKIFKFVREIVGQSVPLVMGTGVNSTSKSIELTKLASDLGADAALVVVPYYNKPPQRGLVQHFLAIADQSKIPMILYNVPGRTITALSVEAIAELAKHPRIIGIKEASGDIQFLRKIKATVPSDFILLSGDDGTYLQFLEAGGHGVISVASHILPEVFVRWTHSFQNLDLKAESARAEGFKQLIDLLFSEANPIPVKWALKDLSIIESAEMRLPLVELSPELQQAVHKELINKGLKNEK